MFAHNVPQMYAHSYHEDSEDFASGTRSPSLVDSGALVFFMRVYLYNLHPHAAR
jgi:hypothetical protein